MRSVPRVRRKYDGCRASVASYERDECAQTRRYDTAENLCAPAAAAARCSMACLYLCAMRICAMLINMRAARSAQRALPRQECARRATLMPLDGLPISRCADYTSRHISTGGEGAMPPPGLRLPQALFNYAYAVRRRTLAFSSFSPCVFSRRFCRFATRAMF